MKTVRAMNPYTRARMESTLLRIRGMREKLEREQKAKETDKKVEA
jgi:hypothetical protein